MYTKTWQNESEYGEFPEKTTAYNLNSSFAPTDWVFLLAGY